VKEYKFENLTVLLIQGDITELKVDAIVNAANSYLKHGGGVAGAIVRKGGRIIQEESDRYVREHGPVPVGGVAVTSAGKLKAKYVIHTVGPVYGEEIGDEKLASAIRSSLEKAEELGLNSIAMPAISTGIFGYPYERCASIMFNEILKFSEEAKSVKKIVVCLYTDEAYKVFEKVFESYYKTLKTE